MTNNQLAVLRFGDRRVTRSLAPLPCHDIAAGTDVDAALEGVRRVVVVGDDVDLATVLTRLMRIERLDVEVAHVPGLLGSRRAKHAVAQRVPLIRDETGAVLVGAALWLPPDGASVVHGEAVVDDEVLFDGDAPGVRIEPTSTMPGLRASVLSGGMGPRRWSGGRAVQLGTTGARVVREGVPVTREVKRSAFYRHVTGWLQVR
ncbi:peptidase M50 [Candidatus Mycolicibacterium alkanivorans]|uniref:Peptidase M50 n=1 Tax=Candidatus Mycolicibacterium alkanivorans TaxID=2954114 RepID=A0ABS9YR36_9MYCO|nr:peptidase M50 [Candidatus Mycolicibacterium alkanivorans]MCI4673709.1 peptidase M50 [Candidatus Mycolicibacterium alkanivorans]